MRRIFFKLFTLITLLTVTYLGAVSAPVLGDAYPAFQPEAANSEVYLGGTPLGITIGTGGVIIVGKNTVITDSGAVEPFAGITLEKGDILTTVEGIKVENPADITKALRLAKKARVDVKIVRRGETLTFNIAPARDSLTRELRLGITVKEDISGIGTLTYIKQDMRYGALGHHISDEDTGLFSELKRGFVYPCTVYSVKRGEKGKAGGLNGSFNRFGKPIGTIDTNNSFGLFGSMNTVAADAVKIPVGRASKIEHGAAKIYTTVSGNKPDYYDIDIVKTVSQNQPEVKGLVISVTDKRLLELTGGIVQGMSGSPIVQNGKLIGAVTHVFVNDPTRGYGVYIEWMLENY